MTTADVAPPVDSGAARGNSSASVAQRAESAPAYDFRPDYSRRELRAVALPAAARVKLQLRGTILLVGEPTGLGAALAASLSAAGVGAMNIAADAATDVVERLDRAGDLGGLIYVAAEGGEGHASRAIIAELGHAFRWIQAAGRLLSKSTSGPAGLLASVARMDGAFGLRGVYASAGSGGLAGLIKTAAQEWPALSCRALDAGGDWSNEREAAEAICGALADPRAPLEVGLSRGGRVGLQLVRAELPDGGGQLPLGAGDVVLVTGGARGVTAECVCALGHAARPTFVLLGRSSPPTEEPDWQRAAEDAVQLKRAMLAHKFRDVAKRPTPAQVDAAVQEVLAQREVARNLERIAATGARVEYRAVDVRDSGAVESLCAEVRERIGPIRGLVHAAGVIADAKFERKTADQFNRVVETKLGGLASLLHATREDDLRAIAFFSSVSARYGREGQCDYAAANEVLNKTAHVLARQRPNCRVVSIGWGPWAGGMVNPTLKAEFARLGVGLVPLREGAECFVRELAQRPGAAVEVLIGGELPNQKTPAAPTSSEGASGPGRFEQSLSLAALPELADHVLAGRPVVPIAMLLNWFARAASARGDGTELRGLHDVRILKPCAIEASERIAVIERSAGVDGAGTFELRSAGSGDSDGSTLHARATVIRGEAAPAAGGRALAGQSGLPSARRYYGNALFHGPAWQMLDSLEAMSERGIRARVSRPGALRPSGQSGDVAPVWLLDAALQLGLIWSAEFRRLPSIPTYIAACDIHGVRHCDAGVVELLVDAVGPHRLRGDVTIHAEAGGAVCTLRGVDWMLDAGLRAAFANDGAGATA